MSYDAEAILVKIKHEHPLILNVCQYFPCDLLVDGLQSLGAKAIGSNSPQEIEEFIKIADIVVINLGQFDDHFMTLCEQACQLANKFKKPILLNAVEVSSNQYRLEACVKLIQQHAISIVYGYPHEIASLLEEKLMARKDEERLNELVVENARLISAKYNCTVIVSGKTNAVIDFDKINYFHFNSDFLFNVRGISNLLVAITAAFYAIEKDRYLASIKALAFYEYCIRIAEAKANGPGSLKIKLIDQLYIHSGLAIGERKKG